MKELLNQRLGEERGDVAFCLLKERVEQGETVNIKIEGNSMFPFLKQNDTISVRKVEFQDLRKGEIIVYKAGKHLHAHRYIRLTSSNKLVTKGDNNSHFDSLLVSAEQLIGKVVLIKKDKEVMTLEVVSRKIINYFLGSVFILDKYIGLFFRFLNENFFRNTKGHFKILITKGLHFIFSIPFKLTVRRVNLEK